MKNVKLIIGELKRNVVICTIAFSLWNLTSSQVGGGIVHDPANAANLMNILSSMKELKEVQEEAKSNTDFLNKVMKESKEVKRLLSLMETIICATDEFQIYIGVVGDLTLCNRKLNLDMTLSRIEGLSGKLKTIGVGVYMMSQYETVESLKSLNDDLEKSIGDMQRINTELRMDVVSTLRSSSAKSKGQSKVSWLTGSNI